MARSLSPSDLLATRHVAGPEHRVLQLGTRGSALALWQANAVKDALRAHHPNLQVELEIIRSEGDADKHSPLTAIGGRGVFTSALQQALLKGAIDLAVHSAKDVPSLTPAGLTITAYPQREDPRDALISRHDVPLAELPVNPVIGTSSRRRAGQIQALRPDARIVDLRGNIDTRLAKGKSDAFDAVILAAAGLTRMGWAGEITELLAIERFTPAPAQGALAVETRSEPDGAAAAVDVLDDPDIRQAVEIERAFLRGVGGGCTTPIGAYAIVERVEGRETARLWAMLASDDGTRLERIDETFRADEAKDAAFAIAGRLVRELRPRWTGLDRAEANDLRGRTVLVTGTKGQATALIGALESRGARGLYMPTIEILPPTGEQNRLLGEAIARARAGAYDWIVFTSANAVGAAVKHIGWSEGGFGARVAAVGTRTADRLREVGIEPALVPEVQAANGLLEAFHGRGLEKDRILCVLGDRARPTLVDGLQANGASVDVAIGYRNRDVTSVDIAKLALIRRGEADVITFASPSAVAGFVRLTGADLPAVSGAAFVAIGPTTAEAMKTHGLPVHTVAAQPNAAGLIDAITAYFGGDSVPSNASITSGDPREH